DGVGPVPVGHTQLLSGGLVLAAKSGVRESAGNLDSAADESLLEKEIVGPVPRAENGRAVVTVAAAGVGGVSRRLPVAEWGTVDTTDTEPTEISSLAGRVKRLQGQDEHVELMGKRRLKSLDLP